MLDRIKDPVISRSGRIYSAAGLLALAAVLAGDSRETAKRRCNRLACKTIRIGKAKCG